METDNQNNANEIQKSSSSSSVVVDDHPLLNPPPPPPSQQQKHQIPNDNINCDDSSFSSSTSQSSSTTITTTTIETETSNRSTKSSSSFNDSQFQYKACGKLLGIKFLKNERNGFEQEIERTMHKFVVNNLLIQNDYQQQQQSSSTSLSSAPILPLIYINIPKNLNDFVNIQIVFNSNNNNEPNDDHNHGDNDNDIDNNIEINGSKLFLENNFFNKIKNFNQEFFKEFPDEIYIRNNLLSSNNNPIRILVNQLFLYRGQLNSPIENCLTMTTIFLSNRLQQNNRYQQCFIVLFESPSKITDFLNIFRKLHGLQDNSLKSSSSLLKMKSINSSSSTSSFHQSSKTALLNNNLNQITHLNEFKVVIQADLEIQEEIYDGKWETCPYEKDSFKLRTNLEKKILITLQQDLTNHNYPIMIIERCFGMLLSPGRNVSPNQMVAIGLNSMTSSYILTNNNNSNHQLESNQQQQQKQWQIIANWIPLEVDSEHLNTETQRNSRIYFTIALDLILEQVEEPIRFVFESKAKILPSSQSTTEKLWKNITNLSKNLQRSMQESFSLIVRQRNNLKQNNGGEKTLFEVISCLSTAQIAMHKQRLSMQLNLNNKFSPKQQQNNSNNANQLTSTTTPGSPVPPGSSSSLELETTNTPTSSLELENEENDDEPLQSGSGLIRLECTKNELQTWQNIMEKWNQSENHSIRPKLLANYVRRGNGIPQALRPEVWQLLSRAHEIEGKILSKYKLLVTQESSFESIILRDISRTFTAHEKFRDATTGEQESLFRICKAYSNYDAEIGYCQGLSYLVAALLLNMPEEQAFCVLIQIMYKYGLRDLFKSGLENLHCKFYQLERLLDDQIPELFSHFMDLKIEAHMYASQWFLTLFTTKFPLNVVFMIIDLFLLDEMDVILQIGLGLLEMSKNDLLALDFEGIMKYFRITLPKLYRNDDVAKKLIHRSIKINVKKAKKYEQQFKEWQEKNRDPFEILQLENKRLMQTCARLEQENDDLTQELLACCQSKIRMQKEVDRAEDKADTLNTVLLQTRTHLIDSDEDRKQLTEELQNLKIMCRKEIDRYELEKRNDQKIIEEYKQICRNFQEKLELEKKQSKEKFDKIFKKFNSCPKCMEQNENFLLELNNNDGNNQNQNNNGHTTDNNDNEMDPGKKDLYNKIEDLESELIKTKIALAESEDRNGQLVGKLHLTNTELNHLKSLNDERSTTTVQSNSNTWFSKTLSTLRDAATNSSIGGSISSSGGGGNNSKQQQQFKLSSSISSSLSSSTTTTESNQDERQQQQKQLKN